MDTRENMYFLILYLMIFLAFGYAVFKVGLNIYMIHELYTVSKSISDLLYAGSASYYLGGYLELESKEFENMNCISKYNGFLSEYIKCNGRRIPFLKISYPLLMNTKASNPYLMIERGQIAYGPYHYLYLTITTRRIIVFNINHNDKDVVDTFFKAFSKIIPTNYVIAFCHDNNIIAFLDTHTKEMRDSNKNDFLSPYMVVGSIEELFRVNNMQGFMRSHECNRGFHYLKNNYNDFDPLLVYVVDAPDKCNPSYDCIVLTRHNRKYILNDFQMDLRDEYDLLLLLFFKELYGIVENDNDYSVDESIFRRLWIDYLYYYSQLLSKRYKYIVDNKEYSDAYLSCKPLLRSLSEMLCGGTDSICKLTNSTLSIHNIDSILNKLEEIKNLYIDEVIKGCEGEIYM